MNKKELILKLLSLSDTQQTLQDFVYQMMDVIAQDDKDLKERVEKVKQNFALQLPAFIEENYVAAYEATFTEEELQALLAHTESGLGQKVIKFNSDLAVSIKPKFEDWTQKLFEAEFADLLG